jgi:hypothetical protein
MMFPSIGRRAMLMRPFLIIILLLAAAGLVGLLGSRGLKSGSGDVPTLTLSVTATDQIIYERALSVGSPFAIRYIHSIHRTPVEEWFHIDSENQIILDRVIYESLGVGNPTTIEEGQTLRLLDGKLIIEGMNRVLGRFVLATGQVIADHRLIIEGEEIPLADLCPPGTSVLIEARY